MDIQDHEVKDAASRFAGELRQLVQREVSAGRLDPERAKARMESIGAAVLTFHQDGSDLVGLTDGPDPNDQADTGEASGNPADRAERFTSGLQAARRRMAGEAEDREPAGEDDDQGNAGELPRGGEALNDITTTKFLANMLQGAARALVQTVLDIVLIYEAHGGDRQRVSEDQLAQIEELAQRTTAEVQRIMQTNRTNEQPDQAGSGAAPDRQP